MLRTSIASASSVSKETRARMYGIFSNYYAATSYDQFASDLRAKTFALLLHDERGVLRGFSTLELTRARVFGEQLRVVFSGDTIIERAYWGTQALAFAWLRHIGGEIASEPDVPTYWLLTVKGHRTYRYLPAFGREFTPDWRRPADPRLEKLKHELARRRFADAYDPETGLVKFAASRGHLAPEWASVEPREMARPDVRFFLERNPGYARGDELVCLCRLSEDNMRPLTRRLFRQGFSA